MSPPLSPLERTSIAYATFAAAVVGWRWPSGLVLVLGALYTQIGFVNGSVGRSHDGLVQTWEQILFRKPIVARQE